MSTPILLLNAGSSSIKYQVIDAALGVIERGSYRVKDSVAQQPWMPDGPIPLDVNWTRTPASVLT